MIGLLGKKVGMTQVFDEQGRQIPVTVIELGPCFVTDLRTPKKNGYTAVQLGFDEVKEKKLNKPKLGQMKKIHLAPLKFVREIRTETVEGLTLGQQLTVDNFEVGDIVDVEGVSIGKGFQGVVKRHHFKGDASKSHGSMFGRVPGSIGASSFPSRVVKGLRAAGQMGNENVTVQNLKVVKVDEKNNLLAVKGAVPGVENGYLVVRTALKKSKKKISKWKVPQGSESSKEVQKEQKEAPAQDTPQASEEKS